MLGDGALRYKDRYIVKKINYTDNSKEYTVMMQADNGIYKNKLVTLFGDVHYSRSDGMSFITQRARYNKKSADVISNTPYRADLNGTIVEGSYIKYNNKTGIIFSKDVVAKIQLQEDRN